MYYHFINGQRYDGALIRNAQFRVRDQGDGRISLADAQTLWQLAMDGGRITEIEEETLNYLIGDLNWTEKAEEWMVEELAKEVKKVSSYYKIIDGLKYDRKILEKAEELVSGQGDGRISQNDAEFLLPLFGDFGDIRIEEERTLKYLLENFNWTEAAKDWFIQRFDSISKESDVFGRLQYIVSREYDFSKLVFGVKREELRQQQLDYANKKGFPEVLRAALDNLLHYDELLSFRAMIKHPNSEDESEIQNQLRERLEGTRLVLTPGTMDSEPSLPHFPTPLKGEAIAQNWIFGLEQFDLSDDIYWVIVPRDGEKPAYNYVGGANFEDEWPRV